MQQPEPQRDAAAPDLPTPGVPPCEGGTVAKLRVIFGDGYTSKNLWFVGDEGAMVSPEDVEPEPAVRVDPDSTTNAIFAPSDSSNTAPRGRFALTLSSRRVCCHCCCHCCCCCWSGPAAVSQLMCAHHSHSACIATGYFFVRRPPALVCRGHPSSGTQGQRPDLGRA